MPSTPKATIAPSAPTCSRQKLNRAAAVDRGDRPWEERLPCVGVSGSILQPVSRWRLTREALAAITEVTGSEQSSRLSRRSDNPPYVASNKVIRRATVVRSLLRHQTVSVTCSACDRRELGARRFGAAPTCRAVEERLRRYRSYFEFRESVAVVGCSTAAMLEWWDWRVPLSSDRTFPSRRYRRLLWQIDGLVDSGSGRPGRDRRRRAS